MICQWFMPFLTCKMRSSDYEEIFDLLLNLRFYLTITKRQIHPNGKPFSDSKILVLCFSTKEFVLWISIIPADQQKIRACRLLSFQSKSLEAFSFSIRKLIASHCTLIHIHLVVFPYKFLSRNLLKGALIWERRFSVFCLSSRFGDDFLELTF